MDGHPLNSGQDFCYTSLQMPWILRLVVVLLLAELQMVVRAETLDCCASVCSAAHTEQACQAAAPNEACEPEDYLCICEWTTGVDADSNATMVCENLLIPNTGNGGQDMTLMLVGIFFGIAAGCGGMCTCVYCFCVKKEAIKQDITPITIKTDEDGNVCVGDEREIDYKNKKFEVRKRHRESLDDIRLPAAMSQDQSEDFVRGKSLAGSRTSSVRGSAAPMLQPAGSFNGSVTGSMPRSRNTSVQSRSDALGVRTPSRASSVAGRSDALSTLRKAGSFNGRSSAPMSESGWAGNYYDGDQDENDRAKVFLQPQLDQSALMFDLKEETRREKNPNMTDDDFKKEDMEKEGEVAAQRMGLVRVKSWNGTSSFKRPKSPRSGIRVKQAAQQIEEEAAATKKREKELVREHAMAVLGVQRETTADLLATPGTAAAREILRAQTSTPKGPRQKALLGISKDHVDTQLGLGDAGEITHERLNPADQIFAKMNRQALLPVPVTPQSIRRQLPPEPRVDSTVGYSHGDPGIDHLKIRTVEIEGAEALPQMTKTAASVRAAAEQGRSFTAGSLASEENGPSMDARRDSYDTAKEKSVFGGGSVVSRDDLHDMDTSSNAIYKARASNQSQISDVGSLEGPAFPQGGKDWEEDDERDDGSEASGEFGRSQSAESRKSERLMYEKPWGSSSSFGKKVIKGSLTSSFKNTLALAGLSADESRESSRRNSRHGSISSQRSGKFQTLHDHDDAGEGAP